MNEVSMRKAGELVSQSEELNGADLILVIDALSLVIAFLEGSGGSWWILSSLRSELAAQYWTLAVREKP